MSIDSIQFLMWILQHTAHVCYHYNDSISRLLALLLDPHGLLMSDFFFLIRHNCYQVFMSRVKDSSSWPE